MAPETCKRCGSELNDGGCDSCHDARCCTTCDGTGMGVWTLACLRCGGRGYIERRDHDDFEPDVEML